MVAVQPNFSARSLALMCVYLLSIDIVFISTDNAYFNEVPPFFRRTGDNFLALVLELQVLKCSIVIDSVGHYQLKQASNL